METLPRTKAELLDQLKEASSKLEQTLSRLNEEQLTEIKDQAGWSIKDHLDHLAVWQEGIAALLERQPRWQAMGVSSPAVHKLSEDEENAEIRKRTSRLSLAETRQILTASYTRLNRALEGLSDADLFKPYSYYQPDEPYDFGESPIIGRIVGNSSGHYFEHLPWIERIAAAGQSL